MCSGPATMARGGAQVAERRQLSPTLEAVSSFLGGAPPCGAGDDIAKGAVVDADLVDCAAKALLCNLSRDSGLRATEAPMDERFDSDSVPGIPLRTYLQRLYKSFRCTDASFVCALVLMDRVLANTGDGSPFRLTPRNVHRLFFSCAVLATKYNEDQTWCNWDFARIGGVDLEDLNEYELYLFSKLDYKLAVSFEEFHLYRAFLAALADPSLDLPADISGSVAGFGHVAAAEPLKKVPVPLAAPTTAHAVAPREVCCASAVAGLARWWRQWSHSEDSESNRPRVAWRPRH